MPESRPPAWARGVSLGALALLAAAWAPLGSPGPGPLSLLHLGLVPLLLAAAALPKDHLGRAGGVYRALVPGALLTCAASLALLPLPPTALGLLAPGTARVAGTSWHALALHPAQTLGGLAEALLYLGWAGGVGVLVGLGRARDPLVAVLPAVLVGVAAAAWAHALLGAEAAFGVFPLRATLSRSYLGPLVNPNHLATVLVALVPYAGWVLWDRLQTWPGWVAGLGLVLALPLLVETRAVGAWGALGLALGFGLVTGGGLPGWARLLGLGLALGAPLGVGLAAARVDDVASSLGDRLVQWRSSLPLLLEHPVAGTGLNGYEVAFPRFDATLLHRSTAHLHNDWGEWVLETGLVGGLALAAALGALAWRWPRAPGRPRRARALELGLLAAALHLGVDFSTQVPAVTLTLLVVLAGRLSGVGLGAPTSAALLRLLLITLALLQVPAGLWQGSRWVLEASLATGDVERLERFWPAHPELDLLRAQRALDEGDRPAALSAIQESLPKVLLDPVRASRAGLLAVRAGDWTLAERALRVSLAQNPLDYRAWLALARVLTRQGQAEAAHEALGRALRAGPVDEATLAACWGAIPDGAPWLAALADGEAAQLIALSRFLLERDPEVGAEAALRAAQKDDRYRRSPYLAEALAAADRLEEAEAHLRDLLAEQPQSVVGWSRLGTVLLAAERPAEAAEAFLQAGRIGGGGQALSRAVQAEEEARGAASAEAMAERLAYERPNELHLVYERARLHLARGEAVRCLELLEGTTLVVPKDLNPRWQALSRKCREARRSASP